MAEGCIFCAVVAKEADADIVHEGREIVAFRDTNPQASTHILLIPKEHIPSARELRDEHAPMLIEIMRTAADLAKAEGIDEDGWRIVTNVGPHGGQTVHHLHVHLIGGRQMRWPPG
jgi:histidine triad (HIT) family protein